MLAQRQSITAAVDASGNATVYSTTFSGVIRSIVYTKSTYANGVDFAVTLESTGDVVWTGTDVNASAVVYPVAAATVASTGVASTLLQQPIYCANDRVKIIVSSGGVSTTGTFQVVWT